MFFFLVSLTQCSVLYIIVELFILLTYITADDRSYEFSAGHCFVTTVCYSSTVQYRGLTEILVPDLTDRRLVYRFPHRTYDSIEAGGSRLLEAGEVAGDYSANWMGEAEIEDYMW